MTGERKYTIEMQSSLVEKSDGSWAVEIRITGIPTLRVAEDISKWVRGAVDVLEPQR